MASFSEAEFLAIGQEATMARLNADQVKTLEELFTRFDEDDSGFLQLDEQRKAIIYMTSNPSISCDEVDGIAAGWADSCQKDKAGSPLVDRATYLGIMSRFIKKHEIAWCLLKALLEVTDERELMSGDGAAQTRSKGGLTLEDVRLVPARLAECIKKAASQSEDPEAKGMDDATALERANEMLWVANWRTDSKSDAMDIAGLLAAVTPLAHHDFEMKVLPEKPPPEALELGPNAKASTDDAKASASVAGLVLGLRDPASMRGVLAAAAQKAADRVEKLAHHSSLKLLRVRTEESQINDINLEVDMGAGDKETCKHKVYRFLEESESSSMAAAWAYAIDAFIALSVLSLILRPMVDPMDGSQDLVWLILDWTFTIVFIFEFCLRWAVCDATGQWNYLTFWTKPANICDFVAIVPVPLEAILSVDAQGMRLLRMVRLVRLGMLARFARIARRTRMAPPTAMVLIVIWGIYLNHGV